MNIKDILQNGEYYEESKLFYKGGKYGAYGVTMRPTKLLVLSRKVFEE